MTGRRDNGGGRWREVEAFVWREFGAVPCGFSELMCVGGLMELKWKRTGPGLGLLSSMEMISC